MESLRNLVTPKHPNASRRRFMAGAGAVSLTALASGILAGDKEVKGAEVATFGPKGHHRALTDIDILNFALNLEYLEAEFYLRATTGSGLSDSEITGIAGDGKKPTAAETPGAVTVPSSTKVNFTIPLIEDYANTIASDEKRHVDFLRSALGKHAVNRPEIDLSNSFNAAAAAAGIGPAFDPFADDDSFLLGAFIFEDVGVTAYHGGAPFIRNTAYLNAAAGILGTEAYHAGAIRAALAGRSQTNTAIPGIANKITALRAAADASSGGHEVGLTDSGGHFVISPTDANGITFARTFAEVLAIVYLGSSTKPGGFFPSGLSGFIA